jgi:hypothetical protein
VIEPGLRWNTFLGSGGDDRGYSIAVDDSGNLYVAGISKVTWGMPINAHAGGIWDGFVAKLNSSGVRQWHTFLGSGDSDGAYDITVDSSGNVYVTGDSYATWGTPLNAYTGGEDAFVAKLNSSGALQWHTFLGSDDYEGANGITVDSSGNIYIIGTGYTTWGSPVNAHAGRVDAFVAKLNGNNGVRQWNTFLGSGSGDWGYGITVDGSGNVYVSGISEATWGSPVNAHAGGTDAFVAQLNSSGVLQWNTFLGSGNGDWGWGIRVDGSGKIYVSGSSAATWGTPVNAYAGGTMDAFVAQLNASGIVQWNTFLGSGSEDSGGCIVVDGSGTVYVIGTSEANWGTPINPHAGGRYNAFVAAIGTVTTPEINVQQDTTDIPSGTGNYNFGTVNLGSNTSVIFTIENTGTANLLLTGTPKVAISGTHAGDFSVTQQPTSPVAPSGSTTFTLRFAPTAIDTRTATVSIVNNDSDENPYTFTVTGTGQAAAYLLWTRASDGRTSVWTLNASDGFVSAKSYQASGWIATSYQRNIDGTAQLLWMRASDGRTSVWRLNASGGFQSARGYQASGWQATSSYRKSDGSANLLWTRLSDGRASVWKLNSSGGFVSAWGYRANGWQATSVHPGGNGFYYLLWTRPSDGRASVWTLNSSGGFVSAWGYRASGWTAQSVYGQADSSSYQQEGPVIVVRKAGTGNGTIMTDQQTCDAACAELIIPYIEGTMATLQVVPDADSVFVRWETADGVPLANIYYAQPGETVYAVFEKH